MKLIPTNVNVPKKTSDENESIQQEMNWREKKLSIRINLNGCESKAKVSAWACVCVFNCVPVRYIHRPYIQLK